MTLMSRALFKMALPYESLSCHHIDVPDVHSYLAKVDYVRTVTNNLTLDKLDAAHYASLNESQGHCFKWMDESIGRSLI